MRLQPSSPLLALTNQDVLLQSLASELEPSDPLTFRNLRSHTSSFDDMADKTPHTPFKSQTTSHSAFDSTDPSNWVEIRRILKQHNMPYHLDDTELKASGGLDATVAAIIGQHQTGSPGEPTTLPRVKRVVLQYQAGGAENDFLHDFYYEMMADSRLTKSLDPQNALSLGEGDVISINRDWKAKGLHRGFNVPLKKYILPQITTTDKQMNALLKKFPKIKNPQPDILWGLWDSAFSHEDQDTNETFPEYAEVKTQFVHAFAAMQFKPAGGNEQIAINQAIRDGAALVFTRMKFNEQAAPGRPMNRIILKPASRRGSKGSKSSSGRANAQTLDAAAHAGADLNSFAFSFVVSPTQGCILLNWAERRPGQATLFHTSPIREYFLKNDAGLQEFRRAWYAILDWGLGQRKRECSNVLAAVRAKIANNADTVEEQVEESSGDDDIDGENDDEELMGPPSSTNKRPYLVGR